MLMLKLKLKLTYSGHLMQTDDSLEKSLVLGKTEQKEKRVSEDEMAGRRRQCNEHALGKASGVGEGQGGRVCYSPRGQRVQHRWVTEQQ